MACAQYDVAGRVAPSGRRISEVILETPAYPGDISGRRHRLSDGPDSLVLRFMRQVDAKLNRMIDDLGDLKVRVINVEEHLVALNRRVDRMDLRMERIERHLDLANSTA
ncbi:hypothetical protein [Rhodopila sp.]|uniref:hypothetical protein n=1 Tax=Rhodopila sp. TaxID=2480087 RepID=UPI003D098ADC